MCTILREQFALICRALRSPRLCGEAVLSFEVCRLFRISDFELRIFRSGCAMIFKQSWPVNSRASARSSREPGFGTGGRELPCVVHNRAFAAASVTAQEETL